MKSEPECTLALLALPIYFNKPCASLMTNSTIKDLRAKLEKGAYSKLSLQEIASIVQYTSEEGYTDINGILRNSKSYRVHADFSARIKTIASGINKLRNVLRPSVVYRGADFDQKFIDENLKEGEIFYDRGFLSTSTTMGEKFYFSKSVKLIIQIPPQGRLAGAYIADVSEFPSEKEFLFVPLSKFKVTAIKRQSQPTEISSLRPADQAEMSEDKFVNNIEFTSLRNPNIVARSNARAKGKSESFALTDEQSTVVHMEYIP